MKIDFVWALEQLEKEVIKHNPNTANNICNIASHVVARATELEKKLETIK